MFQVDMKCIVSDMKQMRVNVEKILNYGFLKSWKTSNSICSTYFLPSFRFVDFHFITKKKGKKIGYHFLKTGGV